MARGSIETRGKNKDRHRIRIYLGTGPDGVDDYHRETVRGTRAMAEKRLTEILRELDTGGYVERSEVTVEEHLRDWLRDHVAGSDASPTTIAFYEGHIDTYIAPAIGSIRLQTLTPRIVQKLFADLLRSGRRKSAGGLSPATVHGVYRTLHAALEIAVQWGRVARNVCDSTKPPKRSKKRAGDVWSDEEVAQFVRHIEDHRLYALYILCLTTGLRRGEVAGLRWIDVDFDALRIEIHQTIVKIDGREIIKPRPKSEDSEDYLSITPSVAQILRSHKARQSEERIGLGSKYEDHGLVFCQPNGRPLWVGNLSGRAFPKLCRDAGVRVIRFHDLRHTYATKLFEGGADVLTAQRRLRHSKGSTTVDIYGHPSAERERDAAYVTDRFLPKQEREIGSGG